MRIPWGKKRIAGDGILDDEVLTQYGSRIKPVDGRPFKNSPARPRMKNAISLFRGRLTAHEALAYFSGPRNRALKGEGVRYTTAGRLRNAGFKVAFTPNQGNPRHVSVANLDVEPEWTDDDRSRFDGCFGDPEWEEGNSE